MGDGLFPPLRSVDVVPTNLPTVLTELIGHTEEVRRSWGCSDGALVTLTGVGGVGKTRLGLGGGVGVAAGFTDDCWLVISPGRRRRRDRHHGRGRGRSPTTLPRRWWSISPIGGCRSCSTTASTCSTRPPIVRRDPRPDAVDVHVLVTSREPLGLDGEQVRRVQFLGLPRRSPPRPKRRKRRRRCSLRRAVLAAVRDGFANSDTGNVAAGGGDLPAPRRDPALAIELAAARVRGDGACGDRVPSRRAVPAPRRRFAPLGGTASTVVRDGVVVARPAHRRREEPPSVASQCSPCCLISPRRRPSPAAAPSRRRGLRPAARRSFAGGLRRPRRLRYRLLETLRQYGADRLADVGETEATRARHAGYFLALVGTSRTAARRRRCTTTRP